MPSVCSGRAAPCRGVPGFYTDNAGRWTINFGSRTAGILLPAVGMDGLICGMQIRLDTPLRRRDDPPGKSGAKYIWLSSIGKPHGVTSGSPLHFVGEPFAKTVYVTEGLLKRAFLYRSPDGRSNLDLQRLSANVSRTEL